MKITYQIEDGYVGGARPQIVEIDEVEIENCETMDEVEELIYDYCEEDARQRMYVSVDKYSMEDVKAIWENREQDEEE